MSEVPLYTYPSDPSAGLQCMGLVRALAFETPQ